MTPTVAEDVANGMGVIEERTATLAHLRMYIDGVKDLSMLPSATARDVIEMVVDGIVESLERLYTSIEDGAHRDARRRTWLGNRGTNLVDATVGDLLAHPGETFVEAPDGHHA